MTTVDPTPRLGADAPVVTVVPHPSPGPAGIVRAYVALTKPRIIELLLVTTVPTMILAAGGWPGWRLVLATLAGGTLAAGSANALNMYLDRDIDALMQRTAHRPVASGVIAPRDAVVFGVVLGALAVALLAAAVNLLSAALAVAAILFYVVGYTMLLKRRTPQNIVWGGAAGCMPVLIGWSAVTGSLSWPPLVLFGVVFLWTPPHYWPLSLRFRDDYAAAGVPMLPVVASVESVARQSLGYAWAMVACSLMLAPVTGLVYLVTAVVAGAVFLREAYLLLGRARAGRQPLAPMRLFHLSITYLTVLFTAVALDPFLHVTPWA